VRRCTKLRAAEFAIKLRGVTFKLSFSGQGTNPAEHLASMQAQIASFAATPCFLLPPSWPAHPCLTTIALDRMDARFALPPLDLLPHLTNTVSLQSLTLDTIPSPISCEVQAGISALTNLTHLAAPTHDSAANPLDTFWVDAGKLPSLQQLTATAPFPEAAPFKIPRTWEGLANLTHLALGTPRSQPLHLANPDALRWLPALRSVALAMQYSSLQALSSLSHLTALHLHTAGDVPTGGMACSLAQQPEEAGVVGLRGGGSPLHQPVDGPHQPRPEDGPARAAGAHAASDRPPAGPARADIGARQRDGGALRVSSCRQADHALVCTYTPHRQHTAFSHAIIQYVVRWLHACCTFHTY
jgi:hypothetical protein